MRHTKPTSIHIHSVEDAAMDQPKDGIHRYQPVFLGWNLAEKIGEGSFGTVYRMSKSELGEHYDSAVKFITVPTREQLLEAESSLGDDADTLNRYFEDIVKNLVKEVRTLYTLSGYSNIVGYRDHRVERRGDDVGWDIMIMMEYVTSLRKTLRTRRLTRENIIRLGIDICSALEMCSKKGLIHRDIKDENIFVNEDGVFKLGDFGIARQLDGVDTVRSKKGTFAFMAPEVYRGDRYDAAVDIYSLGIVMYRLLNHGRMPFLPPYPEPVRVIDSELALERRMHGEDLPLPDQAEKALGGVILRACAFNPSDRFENAAAFRKSLMEVVAGLTADQRAEPITPVRADDRGHEPSGSEGQAQSTGSSCEDAVNDGSAIDCHEGVDMVSKGTVGINFDEIPEVSRPAVIRVAKCFDSDKDGMQDAEKTVGVIGDIPEGGSHTEVISRGRSEGVSDSITPPLLSDNLNGSAPFDNAIDEMSSDTEAFAWEAVQKQNEEYDEPRSMKRFWLWFLIIVGVVFFILMASANSPEMAAVMVSLFLADVVAIMLLIFLT